MENVNTVRRDAQIIMEHALAAVLPHQAVEAALRNKQFSGRIYLAAIGKAAFAMAEAAQQVLGTALVKGIVITKYGHATGNLPGMEIIEAGHPVLDENTLRGTSQVLAMVKELQAEDTLLFLVSGGGSALFEQPLPGITLDDLQAVASQLLACGADIIEINTIRKRLSAVKGGRFALACQPAQIFAIVLSDVLGDRLDSIASGPAYPDTSTSAEALAIIDKYKLQLPAHIMARLAEETPKALDNVETVITGSVRTLCAKAAEAAARLGYEPLILTTQLSCEAREAGRFLAAIAKDVRQGDCHKTPCAIIAGGETVVTLKGKGRGGRNQELALAAAEGIAGFRDTVIFSVGSDGTDGPTDAAGGIVDGGTKERLQQQGITIDRVLADNDAYHGLQADDGLLTRGLPVRMSMMWQFCCVVRGPFSYSLQEFFWLARGW